MTVGINGVAQAPAFKKVTSTPPPGLEWEGIVLNYVRPGEKTELVICLKNAVDAYEWVKSGEST